MSVSVCDGVVSGGVRDFNSGFLSVFSATQDGVSFSCIRVGNESRLHMKLDDGVHQVRVMCDLDVLAKSFVHAETVKGGSDLRVCIDDIPAKGEKSKPSKMTFDFCKFGKWVSVSGVGPDDRNRSRAIGHDGGLVLDGRVLGFFRGVVGDHMNMIEFECVGNKVDMKKVSRRLDLLKDFAGWL